MKLSAWIASALCILGLGGAVAASPAIPAYVKAAVADPHRPAADTALDPERKPADMVVFAGIKPGDTVVDLIPGGGYFTRIFSKAVGPKGHVYSFQPTEMDRFNKDGKRAPIFAIAADPAYANVTVLNAPIDDFSTPAKVDVVWTSQNYHDLHDPFMGPADMAKVNKAIFDALKPGGVYIVLDHAAAPGTGTADTNTLHRIDPAVVKQEVAAAGFKFAGHSDVLRNPKDDHTLKVFDPRIRHHTDQFIYKFRKPAK
ncbi:MAG: class I SAM-dependent methyltransferase [Alphaproteobacteria bacterium]|nr:class I SAM-dependent methyltransferase [Alphaproteobacteria bacterium]